MCLPQNQVHNDGCPLPRLSKVKLQLTAQDQKPGSYFVILELPKPSEMCSQLHLKFHRRKVKSEPQSRLFLT